MTVHTVGYPGSDLLSPPVAWWTAEGGVAYGANPAGLTTRNGPPVFVFDDATEEAIFFPGVAHPDLATTNVKAQIDWTAATAVAGSVVWSVALERIQAGVTDIDADSFAAAKTVASVANAVSGATSSAEITFTTAEAVGLAAGDAFRLLLKRVAADGSDDMVGDAEVLRVKLVAENP